MVKTYLVLSFFFKENIENTKLIEKEQKAPKMGVLCVF